MFGTGKYNMEGAFRINFKELPYDIFLKLWKYVQKCTADNNLKTGTKKTPAIDESKKPRDDISKLTKELGI